MSDCESIPSDIEEAATTVVSSLLPEKSKIKYEQAYGRLCEWCDQKKIKNEASEKVLLVYFQNLSQRYKSSSLWAYYSMIRMMISIKKNVDISKYIQLVAFLKRKSEGYKPKKSSILTKQDVTKFLQEAEDEKWLLTKVNDAIPIINSYLKTYSLGCFNFGTLWCL
jgi:tRNA 2-selenouridine synthase SelU